MKAPASAVALATANQTQRPMTGLTKVLGLKRRPSRALA